MTKRRGIHSPARTSWSRAQAIVAGRTFEGAQRVIEQGIPALPQNSYTFDKALKAQHKGTRGVECQGKVGFQAKAELPSSQRLLGPHAESQQRKPEPLPEPVHSARVQRGRRAASAALQHIAVLDLSENPHLSEEDLDCQKKSSFCQRPFRAAVLDPAKHQRELPVLPAARPMPDPAANLCARASGKSRWRTCNEFRTSQTFRDT